jgi:hypothetical protein
MQGEIMVEKIRHLVKVREMVHVARIMYHAHGDEAHLRFLRNIEKIYDDMLAKVKQEQAEARQREIRVLPRFEVTDIDKIFAVP